MRQRKHSPEFQNSYVARYLHYIIELYIICFTSLISNIQAFGRVTLPFYPEDGRVDSAILP